jgi:hypothetical protein
MKLFQSMKATKKDADQNPDNKEEIISLNTSVLNPVNHKDGEYLPRVPYDDNETERCSVCHIIPGGLHHDGCYMERGWSSRRGQRLISCGCVKE